MRSDLPLGRVGRMPVTVHVSWGVIALAIVAAFGVIVHAQRPDWHPAMLAAGAIATAGAYLASLLLHELVHVLVARARGVAVRAVTIFGLGGAAQTKHETADPATEFWMGLAGPAVSIVVSSLCFAVSLRLGWTPGAPAPSLGLAVVIWTGYLNITLALLNLLPGFPLDGGRVVRAILWRVTGDGIRSTTIASSVGQAVGLGVIALGLWRLTVDHNLHGCWLVLLGWVLADASRTGTTGAEWLTSLRRVRVRDIMGQHYLAVDASMMVHQFLVKYAFRTGQRCFLVRDQGRLIGLITPQDARQLPREAWAATPVRRVMRRLGELRAVGPETPVSEALATMRREHLTQLPVVSHGRLEGILQRGHIWATLQPEPELTM